MPEWLNEEKGKNGILHDQLANESTFTEFLVSVAYCLDFEIILKSEREEMTTLQAANCMNLEMRCVIRCCTGDA